MVSVEHVEGEEAEKAESIEDGEDPAGGGAASLKNKAGASSGFEREGLTPLRSRIQAG